jgi:hypothetical protein
MAKKNLAPTTTSPLPAMGKNGPPVNVRMPTPNLKLVSKKNQSKGAPTSGTAAHRTGIQERLGAQLRPTAVLYEANAAEAAMGGKNVRLMSPAKGNSGFWAKRQYGQVAQ